MLEKGSIEACNANANAYFCLLGRSWCCWRRAASNMVSLMLMLISVYWGGAGDAGEGQH
jgi:hypothetical protein